MLRITEDRHAGCLDNFVIGARAAIKGVADRIELIARDGAAVGKFDRVLVP